MPADPSHVAFRRFELTIGVYLPAGAPLPDTFREWIERAGFECNNVASPSTLERVIETRYPLSGDVIEKRRNSLYIGSSGGFVWPLAEDEVDWDA